ncbi:short chain dehydrogenase [Dulcicalothrix desertica PCC 7102]|uniref:Short chain dehydrogenase n=1 Tax=Dulcicalothrix desertica PCC 7102 TaxID=232991 RepID=A0A3S1B4M0_9CYAN|nr:SDR family oxidoreductase [Dulcicalothrix desertica]RUT04677.1 short chain dehydrogenase [Dulcicalothrix desertica PCC 7102]TWH42683.1 NAD(P)-dependent dehydrogenase (short-subunit alcohol dehydrogenase family) [Dulcicalothrix desertica PCC 7102]
MFLKDKVAIVTGASSGIGRACAIALASTGAIVVAASRRISEGEETIQLVKEAGGDGIFVQTDVSKEADVQRLVEKTVAYYGRLDFACNNAGIEQVPTPLSEQTETVFDEVINTNVKGVWLCMKHQIPYMLENGKGAIVNIASAAGLIGCPTIPIYCASKHAVIGLTKSLAVEYASQKIRINAVCPGVIKTDMVTRAGEVNPQFIEHLNNMHPMKRVGTPDEVANSVVWLLSEQSSFITGHTLTIDGGFVAQ